MTYAEFLKLKNKEGSYNYYYRFRNLIVKSKIHFADDCVKIENGDLKITNEVNFFRVMDSRQTPFRFEECYLVKDGMKMLGYIFR